MVFSSASDIGKPRMMTLAEYLAFLSATCKISNGEDSLLSWKVVRTERVTTRFKTLAKEDDGFTPIVIITLDSLPIFVNKAFMTDDWRAQSTKEVTSEEIARNASMDLKNDRRTHSNVEHSISRVTKSAELLCNVFAVDTIFTEPG
ncbi:hypothetical protein GJ496_005531 [Pomphorhynchus laevis]|nr:hypothetical protein GJ496_005531 [Pomphorhynchus laevis]